MKNMRMKRNNDRMLLESLIRKYGKNGITRAINEMSHDHDAIEISVDYVPNDDAEIFGDIRCFRKNDIKAVYDENVVWDNMTFIARSERAKYALTDYMLNYYNYGDIAMIEEYWPELLPYVDGCEGTFNDCF
jgi:hypothetical protein